MLDEIFCRESQGVMVGEDVVHGAGRSSCRRDQESVSVAKGWTLVEVLS